MLLSGCAGAWISHWKNTEQWIQADFCSPHRLYTITTQGRADWEQWVERYTLRGSQDGIQWTNIGDRYRPANSDQNTAVRSLLGDVVARFIRLHPLRWHHHISMRWGVTGCPADQVAHSSEPSLTPSLNDDN